MKNKILGNLGENIVKRYLIKMNYEIIKTNFVCKQGEIDLIAKDKKEFVFIEVKTRINKKFGYGIEAVNKNKQRHIRGATRYYIYKNNLENESMRFDIIEVYLKEKTYFIHHVKNVLW